MKFPQPFYRRSKKSWYLQLGKRQFCLGTSKREAFRRYREILLHEEGKHPEPGRRLTVAQVCDLFLEWSSRHNDPKTYQWYRMFLQGFCDAQRGRKAMDLKPFHVTRWLDSQLGWGEATRRCATIAVKRAFNWADGEGHLPANPIKAVRKGPPKRRERVLTEDERSQIPRAGRGQPFREFLQALQQTGYQHLRERREHLRQAATQATQGRR
jgi:integrase